MRTAYPPSAPADKAALSTTLAGKAVWNIEYTSDGEKTSRFRPAGGLGFGRGDLPQVI